MTARAEQTVFESAPERGVIPYPHYVHLNKAELAALRQEAGGIKNLFTVLENPDETGRRRGFEGGAGWAAHVFAEQLWFLAQAFEDMNEPVVTPGALSFVRRDYVEIDDGKVRESQRHSGWHVTSGMGVGIVVSFTELYSWVRRFFYTNYEDLDVQEQKQSELLDLLRKHRNVVICQDEEAFMSTRSRQKRASG